MHNLTRLVVVCSLSVLWGCAIKPIDAAETTPQQDRPGPAADNGPELSGDTSASQKAPGARDSTFYAVDPRLVDQYTIGVDDVVQVSVWRNPELSVTVPVRPDGMISIPLIGDVQAGGRTPNQVAAEVQQLLEKYVRNPRVAIILTQLKSHEFLSRIRVTGAIKNPTSIPYRQGMTVLDVVLAAGGVNEFASANKTRIYRKQKEGMKTFRVRLGDILAKGKLDTNYDLEPGDVITVPERVF